MINVKFLAEFKPVARFYFPFKLMRVTYLKQIIFRLLFWITTLGEPMKNEYKNPFDHLDDLLVMLLDFFEGK